MATVALLIYLALMAFAIERAQPSRGRSLQAIVQAVFGNRWRVAWCIAGYESTWRPWAVNGVNKGLFQISVTAHPWVNQARILDPLYNSQVAYRISRGGTDWSPWTTHGRCGV